MSNQTIIVAGLGRCGSSLVMQMLHAAGVPVTGEYPAFEDDRINDFTTAHLFAGEWRGKAVKILDPDRVDLHLKDCHIIWLTRDEQQQALSIAKFAYLAAGMPPCNRGQLRRMARNLVDSRIVCKRILRSDNRPFMEMSFESLITNPLAAATRIAEFVALQDKATVMAAIVKNRTVSCYNGLLEVELMQEAA